MLVTKRNGSLQEFSKEKIKKAIISAYKAKNECIAKEDLEKIVSSIRIYDKIHIEEIQDQIEKILMKSNPSVAKAFIIYREEHKNDREMGILKQYIKDYINSSNAATGSKYDANSNVVNKNVATLNGELFKGKQIALNRSRMYDMNTKLWGKDVADMYNKMLEKHELYKHDETSPIYPYCVAITMYPMLIDGLQNLGGISNPPRHLRSFCGIFVNMVFTVAAQFAGAVATPEFLMYFDYFCRKEWGEDYYKRLNEVVEKAKDGDRTIEHVIKDYLQNIVYYLNQPAAARNFQCVRENTQLWTPKGFRSLHELKEGDECYVWEDGKYSIQTIKKLNIYNYDSSRDGKLIRFKGKNYQQTVTPNHRVVYKVPNSDKFSIKEAKDLKGHSKLSCPISGKISREDYPIWDEVLILCTYALTDGSIVREKDDYKLSYYMSPNRSGFNEVIHNLNRMGIGYTVRASESAMFGTVNKISLTSKDSYLICRQLENTKKKLPGFFKELSERQAKIVLNCWSKSDGQQLRDGRLLMQCDNEEIASSLQEVALLAGYGSSIEYHESNSIGGDGKCNTLYVTTYLRDCKRVSIYEEVDYKGIVWCPTTDAGVVIFREENNIPYISGNSVFWNISYFDKYYFEGIFGDFYFPDGTQPKWESLDFLQRFFMKWFNKERTRKLLTFPVNYSAA